MPILVDGHNLIGRMSALSLQDPDDEEKLIRIIKSFRARTGKAVTIVFDPGTPFSLAGRRRESGIEIVFAPHGTTADEVIARRVEKSRNPRGWLVVTSDRDLASRVASRGARVQSSEDFASELEGLGYVEPDQSDVHLTPEEVDVWLSLFEKKDGKDDLDRTG